MKPSLIPLLALLTLPTACTTMHQTTYNSVTTLNLSAGNTLDFTLAQPWSDTHEPNFRPTEVTLSWTPNALLVNATVTDDDVFTASNADNQYMWELGDTFEVFLQLEGREDYAELHITPTNTRFHAHKPNVEGTDTVTGEWKPIEHWMISPIGFTALATPAAHGWTATFEIPPAVLGLDAYTPGTQLRISFGRYDGGPSREATLSASSPHKELSFHIPEDWQRVKLTD